ncbi:MAG TPA: hypothetical protein P5205_00215 [Candidatus Paceibacterota bacterium]|nr:hypothetical protein [Verrucomicrobiota bacterium]HSA08775.1 hypothetical protein [Candidatus Paceibacterota bacterium]
MKRTPILLRLCFGLTAACLVSAAAWAQVPQLLNFQGRITVGNVNFDGTGQFKFAFVNSAGTVTYWSNDGTGSGGGQPVSAVSLAVSKGLYSVQLGNSTLPNMIALPPTLFTNADLRLRVWFNDGATGFQQFTPDQRLAAVGYAMMAGNVPDGTITVAKLANDVKAGLGSPSSGSTVFSSDANASNFLAAGYVKLPGLRLLAEEWETVAANTSATFPTTSSAKAPIWTGSEAYVFRESAATMGPLGVRFNPANNTWHDIPTNGLPNITDFTPVWIGSELMILAGNPMPTLWAGRYNPATDEWRSVNTVGAPQFSPMDSVVFWTGTELVVMSMSGPSAKRYHPATDTWVSLNTNGAPFIGGMGVQVYWTGTELILRDNMMRLARYNPGTDSWPGVNTNGQPPLSSMSQIAWCGNTLVVLTNGPDMLWGGGRYYPASDSWQPVTTNGAPAFSMGMHTRTNWTGSELAVLNFGTPMERGGYLYNPTSNTWRKMSQSPLSSYISPAIAPDTVWTGTEIVVGPVLLGPTHTYDSARYNPATDSWLTIPACPTFVMYAVPGTIWTGTQALVFGSTGGAPSTQYAFKWAPSPVLYLYQKP